MSDLAVVRIRRAVESECSLIEGWRAEASQWLSRIGTDQWSTAGLDSGEFRQRVERSISSGGTWMAIGQDGTPIGTIAIDGIVDPGLWSPEELDSAVIAHRMIVPRIAGGHGVGMALLAHTERLAEVKGLRYVRLDAWTSNTLLHRYYREKGYRHVRTVEGSESPSAALFERRVNGRVSGWRGHDPEAVPSLPEGARALDVPEGEGAWAEIHAERALAGAQRLELPARGWLRSELSRNELLHLDMFAEARSDGDAGAPSTGEEFPSLAGSLAPDALLLGDEHNVGADGRPEYSAAFGPWAGCGPWLLGALSSREWGRLAMANANEESVTSLVTALGDPSVVALGRRAQAACQRAGIECGVAPHPQYAKRFLNRLQREYGELLLQVSRDGVDMGTWRGWQ